MVLLKALGWLYFPSAPGEGTLVEGMRQDWGTKTLVFLLVLHRSLGPGQMYTVDVLTQSGIRPDEFPSTSHSAGPLQFWTSMLHHCYSLFPLGQCCSLGSADHASVYF